MNKSITYYLTLFVIKQKGIKKTFSQSPIDYQKRRRDDVHIPKARFFKKDRVTSFSILKTQITQISNPENRGKLLLYFHGGAFVSGPAQHHWDSVERIGKETDYTVWMCNYPKAPKHKIEEISDNIDQIYEEALSQFKAENIIVMGDSAGGTLALALTQRLVIKNLNLPSKVVLISPVLDASFTNPEISEVDKKDPMLSKAGVLSAKKMCSENLNDVRISPINGAFTSFPKTYLYLAEYDISYPDQLLLAAKLKDEGIATEINIGNEMPHIWPLLPVMKEARSALKQIINDINA